MSRFEVLCSSGESEVLESQRKLGTGTKWDHEE